MEHTSNQGKNMKNKIKLICLSALLASSASQAYQADIKVTANIDPTAGITLADGTSLANKTVELNYNPQTGLDAYKANVKLWSNAQLDMKVRLASEPELTDALGANPVPLAVTLGTTTLTTHDQNYQYSTLFPSDSVENGSVPLALVIKQKTPGTISNTGTYTGLVSLVVSQATTKDGAAPSSS